MDYILLFVSIFLSITSIIISAFLFIRIEKICDSNKKADNYRNQKKKYRISGFISKKNNYRNIILKTEKKYFGNITGFIGLFFLFVGLLFFAGFAFYQVLPFTRIVLLYIFSISLLIVSFYLQKNNKNNYAVILRTLSGAILLLTAVGSSRFKILEWTNDSFLIFIITAISVLINIFIAYYKGSKSIDKVHILMILFALSLIDQTYYICYIAAVISIIAVFISYKKTELITIYLVSFLYFAYQGFLFHSNFSIFTNIYVLASNIIIIILQFLYYKKKTNDNIKFPQSMIIY
ncbi:MAG: hypothetical protein KAZ87_02240, partial [Spirochaetes bacterium]|nr:hypothetical protein [Spirochaetota bacterium]